ncbi:hypothetical protein Tco_1408335 [Tanacetum coccineum]
MQAMNYTSDVGRNIDMNKNFGSRRVDQPRPIQLVTGLRFLVENAPTMFSIRIHHGGNFEGIKAECYTRKLERLFYNYLRPLPSLDEGLYALACEKDVHCLATLVRSFKLIEVYIEHSVTAVDFYNRPPPRVRATIEEITDEPGSITTIEHRSEKCCC